MNFKLKIEGDVLSFTASAVDNTPEARGRVCRMCRIELALLRLYGRHTSEAVKPDPRADGKMIHQFWRKGSNHTLYMECRAMLKREFGIEA